mgnify:CR=1 FL=1
MGKYYGVEVKPTISVAALAAGNITNGEILFDWKGFDIPGGSAKLASMTIQYKGKNGVDYTPTDLELFWAKSYRGSAPGTLGGDGDVVDTFTSSWFPNIIGKSYIDAGQNSNDGDLIIGNIITCDTTLLGGSAGGDLFAGGELILTPEPGSGSAIGYDKLYVASLAKGTHNWGASTMAINGTMSTDSPVLTVDGVDAIKALSPGDVLRDEDDLLLGTVKTIDSSTQVTLESNLANASTNDKLVYNTTPITFILGFEI